MDPSVLHATEKRSTGYRVKTLDILSDLLGSDGSSGAFGDGLCRRIQTLTGARALCLLKSTTTGRGTASCLVSAYPVDIADSLRSAGLEVLADLSAGHGAARLYRSEDHAVDAERVLRRLGFASALSVPLQTGGGQAWSMLLLDVPGDPGGDGLLAAMELLSALLGLILRQGLFFDDEMWTLPTDPIEKETLHPAAALASSATVGIFRFNTEGGIVYADDRFLSLHGLADGTQIDARWLESLHADDREKVRRECRLAVAQKRGASLTYRTRGRDERTRWVSLLTAPELDRLGLVSGYVGMVSDTTVLSAAEAPTGTVAEEGAGATCMAELQSIQDSFCESLGVNGVIHGLDGRPLTRPFVQNEFCRLVRSVPGGERLCRLDDGVAENGRARREPDGDTCSGCRSFRAEATIAVGGEVLATWIIGQNRLPELSDDELDHLAARTGILPADLGRVHRRTPQLSESSFTRVARIQQQMAREFADMDQASIGLTLDLGELVRIEEERRRSEKSYHTLFNAMLDGFALHEIICDDDGIPCDYRFLDVNPAFEKIFGRRRAEIVGRTAREVFPATDAFWVDTFGGVALDGRSVRFEQHATDIDRYIEVFAYQVEERKFAAVVRDITERKQADDRALQLNELLEERVYLRTRELEQTNAALADSDSRYRRLIDSLRESYFFYSLDPDGRVSYLSDSVTDILGYAVDEFSAGRRQYLTDHPLNEMAERRTEASLQGKRQPPFEMEVRCRDGAACTLEVLEVPVTDDRGLVISVEGIAHDITERKRNRDLFREWQSQLMESEKFAALGSLVAGVAHEISTPVGIGVTAISLLQQHARRCEELYASGQLKRSDLEKFFTSIREASGMIEVNLQRGVDLIQSFKLVAVDQSSEEQRVFHVRDYLEEILLSLRPRLKKPGHRVKLECPAQLEIDGYPGALSQILTNLVLNSVTHAFAPDEPGTVTIEASCNGDLLHLRYSDDGRGMSTEVRSRLFEPFFTTSRASGGSGLGMHIVYNLVTQTLGGRISCASQPGRGSTFTITIPVKEVNGDT